jgi:hypothetical protein
VIWKDKWDMHIFNMHESAAQGSLHDELEKVHKPVYCWKLQLVIVNINKEQNYYSVTWCPEAGILESNKCYRGVHAARWIDKTCFCSNEYWRDSRIVLGNYMKKTSNIQSETVKHGSIRENPHYWRLLQSNEWMEGIADWKDLESTYVFEDYKEKQKCCNYL